MKCNQCDSATISMGGSSAFCHEHGCPNTHKIFNQEEQEWQDPEEDFEEDYEGEYDERMWCG